MNRLCTFVLLLACCAVSAGCYTRQPLGTVPPPPATRLHATITDAGAAAMGATIGEGAVAVEGVVDAASESDWTLHMIRVEHRDGRAIDWNRELVSFPRSTLSNATVVSLDRTRSWLAAGGVVVGALLAARAFGLLFGGDADDRDGGEGPPPQNSVWPRR